MEACSTFGDSSEKKRHRWTSVSLAFQIKRSLLLTCEPLQIDLDDQRSNILLLVESITRTQEEKGAEQQTRRDHH